MTAPNPSADAKCIGVEPTCSLSHATGGGVNLVAHVGVGAKLQQRLRDLGVAAAASSVEGRAASLRRRWGGGGFEGRCP